ncbi:hypothetical protein YB2330_006071 [Saitoella coloradoensis]
MKFTGSALALASILLGSSSASPIAVSRQLQARAITVDDYVSYNASLPNVTIYATGGTIAGSSASNTDTTNYRAGSLGVQVLIDAVPELLNISNVRGVQSSNLDSSSITDAIRLGLAKNITADFASGLTTGAVVTHGTDTLEETAFFLDLTVNTTHHPITVVGAMRPATAISADGPANLLEAVSVAVDPRATNRGTMIVLNDRIGSAFYTTKTHANALDTFRAIEAGYLGYFLDLEPHWYMTPSQPYNKPFFDISEIEDLPKVSILYAHQMFDPALITAATHNASGLIIAGAGAGGLPRSAASTLQAATNASIPIVLSHRSVEGTVPPKEVGIGSSTLNPQKSRILLQLALGAGLGYEEIEELFDGLQ